MVTKPVWELTAPEKQTLRSLGASLLDALNELEGDALEHAAQALGDTMRRMNAKAEAARAATPIAQELLNSAL